MPISRAITLIFLALAMGCGDSGPNRSISGAVTLDGAPLPTGQVLLIPAGAGPTTGADVQDGQYVIDAKRGPIPGQYRVRIEAHRSVGTLNDGSGETFEKLEQYLPSRYNEQSELEITIAEGGDTEFNFDLQSK